MTTPETWQFNLDAARAALLQHRAAIDDAVNTGDIRDLEEHGLAAVETAEELSEQLAESDKRNDTLFELGNKHLDTIDRVKVVLDEYLDPDDTDIECREDVWRFVRDLRAALDGGK